MPGLFGNPAQYHTVGKSNYEKWEAVEGDDAEKVVGKFVVRSWEKVEGDALCKPLERWVPLDVKNHALEKTRKREGAEL